jgi:polyphosphate kinase
LRGPAAGTSAKDLLLPSSSCSIFAETPSTHEHDQLPEMPVSADRANCNTTFMNLDYAVSSAVIPFKDRSNGHKHDHHDDQAPKLKRDKYEQELNKLQTKLVEMQDWVKSTGAKVVVVFEGRDAAGKGGAIHRIMERVSPRVFRHVALPAPTERERSQLYAQRYIKEMPAAGEVVLFDRSWYNRVLVEHVMGFCNDKQYDDFLKMCPSFEALLKNNSIIVVKYWFEVSEKVQHKRFLRRIEDPMRHWKLSPMDLESHRRWYDYSRARDAMFAATDTPESPWYVVQSDNKRRARLNCINHLLHIVPWKQVPHAKVTLPKRQKANGYEPLDWPFRFISERY